MDRSLKAKPCILRRQTTRFFASVVAVYLCFGLTLLGLRVVFACANWSPLRVAGAGLLAQALWKGLAFDGATLSALLLPALVLFYAAGCTGLGLLRRLLFFYLLALHSGAILFGLADLQYFEAAGKHLTYEATAYLNWSAVPIARGAFQLHPWLSGISLLILAGVAAATTCALRHVLSIGLGTGDKRVPLATVWLLPLWLALSILAIRGGARGRPLHVGDACISVNPYVNALCLNPVYALLRTATLPSTPEYFFGTEEANRRLIQQLLRVEPSSASTQYPLQRHSAGSAQGNRKNVVIFILESWSAKVIGALGGPPGATPFFDELAPQGALFDRFYANGLRTAEGIFSILCSFPNQPARPVMKRPNCYSTHWRPLSSILAEAGYENIFVHGRDLGFDDMRGFLRSIHFHRVIDRYQFPSSTPRFHGAWPGFDDEAVVRRAHEEFARPRMRPFLGVIYTMNTHEPFVTPAGYPLRWGAGGGPETQFLNALNYSDYTLRVFFKLAQASPYFTNTIFILVADHARTGDAFNFRCQHWTPLLIYAPGSVPPKLHHIVGSQLDILPTLLALLDLKTTHAAWGQDLLSTPEDHGFAVCVAGSELRWHDSFYLLNDTLGTPSPMLFDVRSDPACTTNLWLQQATLGEERKRNLRAYLSLSQLLLYTDRVYAWHPAR